MEYIVQKGDTLTSIATERLGKPNKWRYIYSYNIYTIGEDPDKILVGQVLNIPKRLNYIKCLKVEEAYYLDLLEEDEDYLGQVFYIQDEIMARQFIGAIKWLIIIGVIYFIYKVVV